MVIMILGVLAAIALPIFSSSVEQTKAQAARNNLMAIAAGQAKYNEDHYAYCLAANCGSTAAINRNFGMNIGADDPFTYSCSAASAPYQCQATDGIDTVTLNATLSAGNVVQTSITCAGPANKCWTT